MSRPHAPGTLLERDIVEAERAVAEFAAKRPEVTVTMLRCANVLGPDVETGFTRMLALPLVPMVLGFDPRLQFVHEDDVVHALEHAAVNRLPGTFNVAADGVLALSEVISLVGRRAAARAAAVRLPDARPAAAPARLPDPGRDGEPAALRARGRQPPLQGDRLHLRLHLARGGDPPRRAHAPRADPARPRPRRGLRLRARGRGVPALEPARAPRARVARASARTGSRSESEAPIASRPEPGGIRERSPYTSIAVGTEASDSSRLPGRDPPHGRGRRVRVGFLALG